MIRDVLVTGIVEIIVIRIFQHPLVEKCPPQNVLAFCQPLSYRTLGSEIA